MKLFDVSRGGSQQLFDSLMLGFITEGLLPFQFVELNAFKKLVATLQPNLRVMFWPTLKNHMKERVETMKQNSF